MKGFSHLNKKGSFLLRTLTVTALVAFVFLPTTATRVSAQSLDDLGGAFADMAICIGMGSVFGSLSSALTTVPVADSVVQQMTSGSVNKECVLDSAAYVAQKNISQAITEQALSYINRGFNGGTAFITNPGQYFSSVADSVANDFIFGESLSNLDPSIRAVVARSLANSYTSNFDNKAKTEIRGLTGSYDDFKSGNFYAGNWQTWLDITQNPFNNPAGAYLEAEKELNKRVSSKVAEEKLIADWSRGLHSVRDQNGEITTPGVLIEGRLNEVLNQDITQLNLADELSEVLGEGIRGAVSGFFKF